MAHHFQLQSGGIRLCTQCGDIRGEDVERPCPNGPVLTTDYVVRSSSSSVVKKLAIDDQKETSNTQPMELKINNDSSNNDSSSSSNNTSRKSGTKRKSRELGGLQVQMKNPYMTSSSGAAAASVSGSNKYVGASSSAAASSSSSASSSSAAAAAVAATAGNNNNNKRQKPNVLTIDEAERRGKEAATSACRVDNGREINHNGGSYIGTVNFIDLPFGFGVWEKKETKESYAGEFFTHTCDLHIHTSY